MKSAVLLPVVFFAVLFCEVKTATLDNEPSVLERVFQDDKKGMMKKFDLASFFYGSYMPRQVERSHNVIE